MMEVAGIFASWEIDLWGRVRAGRDAARFQYESAELDAEYASQSIAALVAERWFRATEARLQKGIAEEMLLASQKLLGLAEDRRRIGRGDEYEGTLAPASLQPHVDALQHL